MARSAVSQAALLCHLHALIQLLAVRNQWDCHCAAVLVGFESFARELTSGASALLTVTGLSGRRQVLAR